MDIEEITDETIYEWAKETAGGLRSPGDMNAIERMKKHIAKLDYQQQLKFYDIVHSLSSDYVEEEPFAICIGCGCDDQHGCEPLRRGDGSCYWLKVDYGEERGICSHCADYLDAWNRGVRFLSPRAKKKRGITCATDGKCHNSEPGTFNHECSKPAEWIGENGNGFRAGFCDHCKQYGYESRDIVKWERLNITVRDGRPTLKSW